MNSDFKELLLALSDREVRFLIVGGYAVMHYSQPRFTKDLDVWLEPSPENARRFVRALTDFGAPLIDISESDFAVSGTQYVLGTPPVQIDFLTSLPGLDFNSCWEARTETCVEGVCIPYIGRDDLISAKKIAARFQDLADIEEIERSGAE